MTTETVLVVLLVLVIAAGYLALSRMEAANTRLRALCDNLEHQLLTAETIREAWRTVALERQATINQLLATPSQQNSQETQRDDTPVVRQLPVAASRLTQYVKEQAAATGMVMTDQEAEQMAASMLVESGI